MRIYREAYEYAFSTGAIARGRWCNVIDKDGLVVPSIRSGLPFGPIPLSTTLCGGAIPS